MSLTHNSYKVAWICALPLEAAAARVMLDKTHSPLPKPSTDSNAYELGELNGHYIVIACLPAGVYGTVSAAAVVSRMHSTFPSLQYGLMVGIGGGVPGENNDIRLGDIVVSKPVGKYSGVIQYDYGKAVQGGQFEPTGTLNKPPQALLTHISQLQAKIMTGDQEDVSKIVWKVLERNPEMKDRFAPPEQHMDFLFHSSYHHADKEDTCGKCDKDKLVKRQPRATRTPYIHYGLIASGDQVMKDSEIRDRLAQQHGILCFEMEAAGLMDELPTLAIRGICDYCDSHKQKQWQGYAALTAAAYTKLLLLGIPNNRSDIDLVTSSKIQHWIVSLARNLKFVGRQEEIVKLEELIMAQDRPRRIAITGLGGVGKTQVALELAYRIRDRDKECSVFWIPCTSRAMIEQMFLHIAQKLGLHNLNMAEVKEQVKIYLSSERAGKWLLIFDNADDAEMWFAPSHTAPPLEDFLPESEQGCILFTTRNRKLAMKLAPFEVFPIPDVDKETALKILEKTLAREDLLRDTTTTTTLLEQLAFLPLAIVQASAYIIENGIKLSTYLVLLQEQEQDAVELLSEDFKDPGRYKDIQNPVITTWLISLEQIQHQDQLAADYLFFMACINPRNIPEILLPQPTSRKQKIEALGLLNAYSFIYSQGTGLGMHRLVHIATRNWLRKNSSFSHWIQRVAEHMQNVFPDNHYTNRGLWREYLPHALAIVHENEFVVQGDNYLGLTEKIAGCLASDGRYQEAEILYKKLTRINQDKAGSEHSSTLRSMANLASTYWNQGRWNEAEKLEVQVMETSKTVLGTEHPDTLTSIANLASTYRNQGRWNEAEKLDVQVMEIRKTVLGTEHPSTLTSIANLASTYRNQGRWNEAEKLFVQVMETRKTVLGAEHPSTLTSMANLASTYWNQGRWNEAEKLFVQAIETRKTVLGTEHPDTLTSMANLASTYWNQGRWNEAEKLEVQVMETRKTVLGAEHPDTLTSMANLASTYRNQGRWNEAEKLFVQVMETRKTVLGAEHPNTLTSMANLASTYWNQGRWNEAEKLDVQVMETRKTVLGAEHPDTLISMANLAFTWKFQGKLQDALSLMDKCCHLHSKVLGPSHQYSRSFSCTLSDWMDEYNALPKQTTLTRKECPQALREVSAGPPAAVVTAQLVREEHINLSYTQRRSAAKLLLGNHPLIIAARTPSPAPEDQDLQDVD
ncbi:kinesin, putative [Talaromyces stipitatus ATCC 10500]|uniref:Kinesin, putative n=1 Tax=Talaromyces stipitatus (strain ATCC 10500 / CBS 375.48 / QM 6759 / NRRL 1006) TaxID=441959 RepID=B8MF36_TALSN|nr:kinesin, putative [Talaromyces stipitatus ATCC 10500]EED16135.1 kinesin, putative [Talaromyces stipitatus ATCC 10500]